MCRISIAAVPLAETGDGGDGHVQAKDGEEGKCREDYPQTRLRRQGFQFSTQFLLEMVVYFSMRFFIFPIRASSFYGPDVLVLQHREALDGNPFGLSSERLALSRRQVVTSVRSVTLLSRIII